MENTDQRYYGKLLQIEESEKYVECIILHFETVNENRWTAMNGSLDAFLDRLKKSKKAVAACYQHDESILIGKWDEFVISGNELRAKLYFVETPFVKETVLPQLRAGILQGASPTISSIRDSYNQDKGRWELMEGVLCEISLVGLPADLKADVVSMRASIESQKRAETDFEIDLLTI